jgi:ParB-like chromosome segregation protein Spo0J
MQQGISDYRWHPAAEKFPLIGGDELEAFAADIKKHGLRDPIVFIVTPDGKKVYIDGRNRLTVCLQEGIPVRETREEMTESEVEAWVMSKNLHGRRHLTTSQRAAIGVSLYRDSGGPRTDDWAERLAADVGTNRQYVYVMDRAAEEMPHLVREVTDGRINAAQAAKMLAQKKGAVDKRPDADDGEEKIADPPEAIDGMGNPVPEQFRKVFARRDDFARAVERIDELTVLLDELVGSEAAAWADPAEVTSYLGSLKNHVEQTAPYAVCPRCGGSGTDARGGRRRTCEVCERKGFVTEARYRGELSIR